MKRKVMKMHRNINGEQKNMELTLLIKKLISIFLIIIIVALIIDYNNVMYPISKNFNYNFLNIFINSLVVIFVFLLTYYMIEKQTANKAEKIENNKRDTLKVLLMQVKKECNNTLDFMENQNILEQLIIPKVNFDSLNNPVEEKLKNNPFKYEQYIIDLFKDGIADFSELEKYMTLKEKYQQYISLRITFYDLDKSKEKIKKAKHKVLKDHLQALHADIYNILNSKCNL